MTWKDKRELRKLKREKKLEQYRAAMEVSPAEDQTSEVLGNLPNIEEFSPSNQTSDKLDTLTKELSDGSEEKKKFTKKAKKV